MNISTLISEFEVIGEGLGVTGNWGEVRLLVTKLDDVVESFPTYFWKSEYIVRYYKLITGNTFLNLHSFSKTCLKNGEWRAKNINRKVSSNALPRINL
jgi:hypothetical protein